MNKNTEKLINRLAWKIAWRIYGPAIVAFGLLGIGLLVIAVLN